MSQQQQQQQQQNKDVSYALRCYQWSVFCLADPYVPCCSGLRDPQRPYSAQADLVTYGSRGSIGHGYRFRLLPVQESFLWTKGASMIISSMCALQLHLLLIHNLLIPQVRLQHAHKCMFHSCMYICVCLFNGNIARLVNIYILMGENMYSYMQQYKCRHIRVINAC